MSTFWWLVLLFAVAVAAFLWHVRARSIPGVPELPGRLPILGNFLELVAHTHDYYEWITEKQRLMGGKSFQLSLPGSLAPAVLMQATEANCRHILKDNFENYSLGSHRRVCHTLCLSFVVCCALA
jgi:hypothetical protein